MIRVLLATTWGIPCGIAEHSAMLKEAVERADLEIQIIPDPTALDPFAASEGGYDILHLNYQGALHSHWTSDAVAQARLSGRYKAIVVTYHDTGVPNSDQCKGVVDAADVTIIHEPADDLPAEKIRYWRMGVPGWQPLYQFERVKGSWCGFRPILGTVGFPFPWKCYDELARVTAANGWALLLIAPGATSVDMARWITLNPHTLILDEFRPRSVVVSMLGACDATAFTYVCHNTGQSGAILQGIAARRPVIALHTCRQFRALALDRLGQQSIHWCETFEDVGYTLRNLFLGRVDPAIVALAEQESWHRLGVKYAALYRELAGR